MEKLKNRIDTVKLGVYLPVIKKVLMQMMFFVISFLFGGITFAGGISPFATGLLGGVKEKYILSTALGAAAGYAVFFGLGNSLRFVGAVVIICILKLFIEGKAEENHKTAAVLAVTGIGTFSVSLCVFLAVGGESTFLIMCLCETLIASAFSLFTLRLSGVFGKQKKGIFFAPADIVSTVFFGCILLLSVDRFSFLGFSPARGIAYFVIMLFAVCGKEAASSVAGISCALTLGFSDSQPHLMASYIMSGIITGICGAYGKIPIGISLVLSAALSIILKGEPDTAVIAIAEAVFSALAFVLIPNKTLTSLSELIMPFSKHTFSEEKKISLHFSLRRSAKAVKDISDTVSAVSSFLEKKDKPTYDEIPSAVTEDICKACNKYDFCWNKCGDISKKAFAEANKILIKNERLISDDLPERLTLICRMPDKITQSFNKAYLEHGARLLARNDIFEAKKAAARQFYCIGSLLDDAAENITLLPEAEPAMAASLQPVFKEMGFTVSGICAHTTVTGKSVLQVYCSHVPVIPDKEILLEKIYEATGKFYLPPVTDEYSNDGTVLSFSEERKYTVEYHTSSHTGAGEDFSGDTCRCFFDGTGSFYTVLSDGMGTGTRAAIDSVMTCNLMSRLMRSGFSPESALETVNCALLVKSAEETLSTLDILKIDLDTGDTKFYKAGACFSVIGKGEKTLVVEKSSLPLGILDETSFEKSEISLGNGDTVLILSDGAAVIPHIYFKEMIRENKNAGVKALAEKAVQKALELSVSGKHDDITVTCIRICEN